MNIDDPNEVDPRVRALARDYLDALESGQLPDRDAYRALHPELSDTIDDCLIGIELAQALRPVDAGVSEVEGAQVIGDFEIVREIGRGGMGVVYEAIQRSLNRRVALKVLPPAVSLDQRCLKRFQLEAQAAAQLHHPNIVPIHDVASHGGTWFYAMQLVPGSPLDAFIRQAKTPEERGDPRTIAAAVADVAEALHYAHSVGIVHRDIKPANLILDDEGRLWITDFGLALVDADGSLTQTGALLGTPRYMSPEQVSGNGPVDARSDVYSLGASLYEWLAGTPAFPEEDRDLVLRRIATNDPRPVRQLRPELPPDLGVIVGKALEKEVSDRYASAKELAADLRRFVAGEAIHATPPTRLRRLRRYLGRHPMLLQWVAIVGALFLIGLSVSVALLGREQERTSRALDDARARAEEAEARFLLARRAADTLTDVAQDELSGEDPANTHARQRVLQTALAYYQELIALGAKNPDSQKSLEADRDRVNRIVKDLALMDEDRSTYLLKSRSIQDELGLSLGQRDQLLRVIRSIEEEWGQNDAANPSSTSERRKELALLRKAGVEALLDPPQRERLAQLTAQMRGPSLLLEHETAKYLELTADQRKRIRTLLGRSRKPGPPRMGSRDGSRNFSPRNRLRSALEFLNPDQRERFRLRFGSLFTGQLEFPSRGRGSHEHDNDDRGFRSPKPPSRD